MVTVCDISRAIAGKSVAEAEQSAVQGSCEQGSGKFRLSFPFGSSYYYSIFIEE
jgi:hypothetical protein